MQMMTEVSNGGEAGVEALLVELGLPERERVAFLAVLEQGGPASRIARRSGLNRTNAYAALERLLERGLIHTTPKRSGKFYRVDDPQALVRLAETRRANAEDLVRRADDIAKLLSRPKTQSEILPVTHEFNGVDGLRMSYHLLLESAGGSLMGIVPRGFDSSPLAEIGDWFIDERLARGISLLCLEPEETFEGVAKGDRQCRRQTRVLPASLASNTSLVEASERVVILANWIRRELYTIVIVHDGIAGLLYRVLHQVWEASAASLERAKRTSGHAVD